MPQDIKAQQGTRFDTHLWALIPQSEIENRLRVWGGLDIYEFSEHWTDARFFMVRMKDGWHSALYNSHSLAFWDRERPITADDGEEALLVRRRDRAVRDVRETRETLGVREGIAATAEAALANYRASRTPAR